LMMPSQGKVWFDGGGNSYIHVDSNDHFEIWHQANQIFRVTGSVIEIDPDAAYGKVAMASGGVFYIGDSANANMTVGLTINAGANHDQVFDLKSSTVTHGLLSYGVAGDTETDTWFHITDRGVNGGASLEAMMENTADKVVMQLSAMGGTADTAKTSAAQGLFSLYAMGHDGSNTRADIAANGNVFNVVAYVGSAWRALFLVDEDGDYWYDGADGGAFDSYDDASLTRAMAVATGGRGVIRDEWDKYVEYNEQTLVDAGILGDTVANGGLVNGAAMQRLHTGAIWQLNTKHMSLAEKVEGLEVELIEAKKQLAAISA